MDQNAVKRRVRMMICNFASSCERASGSWGQNKHSHLAFKGASTQREAANKGKGNRKKGLQRVGLVGAHVSKKVMKGGGLPPGGKRPWGEKRKEPRGGKQLKKAGKAGQPLVSVRPNTPSTREGGDGRGNRLEKKKTK